MSKNKFSEFLIEKGLLITAVFSIFIILVILGFIFIEGLPTFQEVGFFQFLFGLDWAPSDELFGVLPMIVGTLCVTLLSLIIAVPLSILCAIFMAEVADEKVRNFLKPVIQTLSGIPSVVYGFFGLVVLVPFVRTYFGRIRPIPELKSSNFMQRNFGERIAMNSPIQGTAADIIKIAMIHVNERIKKEGLKSRLILQIHDELLIEAEESEVDEVKKILL